MTSSRSDSLGRAVGIGAAMGVLASLAMAMYAMVAAWVDGVGFFTPLHHIASLLTAQDSMMGSMEAAMEGGSDFTVSAGTAVVGAVIHMLTGAGYGAVFGLLVARLRAGTGALVGIGLVYGAAVFALSAFIGLPAAAAIFDSGDQISNMAEMAGWDTFIVEHLLFGLVLGTLVARARRRTSAPAVTVGR